MHRSSYLPPSYWRQWILGYSGITKWYPPIAWWYQSRNRWCYGVSWCSRFTCGKRFHQCHNRMYATLVYYLHEKYIYYKCLYCSIDQNHTNWTHQAILLLIELQRSMANKFTKPPCKQFKLWTQISQSMEEKGYQFSGDDCNNNWRALQTTYHSNKEKKKSSEGAVTWEYFNIMDNFLGERASSLPDESFLQGSKINYQKQVC